MIGRGRGLAALTIATQVGGDNSEVLCQARRDLMPHDMCLRMPVEEQERWTLTTVSHANHGLAGIDHG